MVLTPSAMVPLGTRAPPFTLIEPLTRRTITFSEVRGERGTVIMFICNHCPYVKHVQEELVLIAREYEPKGIGFVAINSNDAEHYPDDAPERMIEEAQRSKYPFPYVFDASQEAARTYNATCTPDFFVYDTEDALVYRGQLDGTRPGKGVPDGSDLRAALDTLLANGSPLENQKPSAGCNIKWKDHVR